MSLFAFQFKFFFFFGLAGRRLGPNLVGVNRARRARLGGSGPRIKNLFNKWAKSGCWVWACGAGPSMKKPNPN